jgi:hypothetical protein
MKIILKGSDKQINNLDRRITYGNTLFNRKELDYKLDKMLFDVASILHLPIKSDEELTLKLYDTKEDIKNRFYLNVPACYTFYNKTVHIAVLEVKNRILSHEFGHVLFDEYLGKRAPGRLGEIIAKYAEARVK